MSLLIMLLRIRFVVAAAVLVLCSTMDFHSVEKESVELGKRNGRWSMRDTDLVAIILAHSRVMIGLWTLSHLLNI